MVDLRSKEIFTPKEKALMQPREMADGYARNLNKERRGLSKTRSEIDKLEQKNPIEYERLNEKYLLAKNALNTGIRELKNYLEGIKVPNKSALTRIRNRALTPLVSYESIMKRKALKEKIVTKKIDKKEKPKSKPVAAKEKSTQRAIELSSLLKRDKYPVGFKRMLTKNLPEITGRYGKVKGENIEVAVKKIQKLYNKEGAKLVIDGKYGAATNRAHERLMEPKSTEKAAEPLDKETKADKEFFTRYEAFLPKGEISVAGRQFRLKDVLRGNANGGQSSLEAKYDISIGDKVLGELVVRFKGGKGVVTIDEPKTGYSNSLDIDLTKLNARTLEYKIQKLAVSEFKHRAKKQIDLFKEGKVNEFNFTRTGVESAGFDLAIETYGNRVAGLVKFIPAKNRPGYVQIVILAEVGEKGANRVAGLQVKESDFFKSKNKEDIQNKIIKRLEKILD